jgi:hypothetical protein
MKPSYPTLKNRFSNLLGDPAMRITALIFLQLAATSFVACGSVAQGGPGDSGPDVQRAIDAHVQPLPDGGRIRDGGSPAEDGRTVPKHDGGQVHQDAGSTQVDAGYYHGDGSYFVDGGAYPDVGSPRDAAMVKDASAVDGGLVAACAALADCCTSLQGASQSFCSLTATANNASDCSVEQSQLASDGDCTGVSVLASQIQVPPNYMVSDGTTLFWTTDATPGLLAMPVQGGAITVLLSSAITNTLIGDNSPVVFLFVDNVNVYLLQNNGVVRIPKDGSPATLVSDPGTLVFAVSVLGSTVYWVEYAGTLDMYETLPVSVKSAPLLGGPARVVASFNFANPPADVGVDLGVTATEVFVGARGQILYDFSIAAGVPAGGLASLAAGGNCDLLTSDTSAIYCAQNSGSNVAIASDGTATTLGPAVSSSHIVFDDAYVYWADLTTVGTVMKAPKSGGATATVIARDTRPTAIAVDANSVYWGDQGGYIKSVPK